MALTKRATKGSALTHAELDANFDHVLDLGNATGTLAEAQVTAHESALTVTEAQISDLGSYTTNAGALTYVEANATAFATAAQGATADSAVQTETDPVVGAINGLVKANGAGVISAAVAGTDYATAAEGDLAATALQPGDIASGAITPRADDIDFSGGSDGDVLTVQADGSLALEAAAGGGASVSDTAYGIGWNGDTTAAPSKNAVYDKIESLATGVTNKFDATAAPTANDDSANTSTNGTFSVGSRWVDVTNDVGYTCVDATATAAVWEQSTFNPSSAADLPTATPASGDLFAIVDVSGSVLATMTRAQAGTYLAGAGTVTAVEFVIDGGGSAITTGIKGFIEVPFAGTISQVTMLADQSGSIVVDIWKDTYANYPPADADSITASAVPTISAATKSQDSTLTGWTTSVAAGDILGFNVDSASTVTRVTISLKITVS